MMQRGITEFLPSITATAIGATAGFFMSGGTVAGAGYGAMLMGGVMEGSSSYNEAMRYMVDEQGMNPEDSIAMATAVSSAYGLVSGWLEKFQLKRAGKMVGLSEDLFEKSFTILMERFLNKYSQKRR